MPLLLEPLAAGCTSFFAHLFLYLYFTETFYPFLVAWLPNISSPGRVHLPSHPEPPGPQLKRSLGVCIRIDPGLGPGPLASRILAWRSIYTPPPPPKKSISDRVHKCTVNHLPVGFIHVSYLSRQHGPSWPLEQTNLSHCPVYHCP